MSRTPNIVGTRVTRLSFLRSLTSAWVPLCWPLSCKVCVTVGRGPSHPSQASKYGSSSGLAPLCSSLLPASAAKCVLGPSVELSAPWREQAPGSAICGCCTFRWLAFWSVAWVLRPVGLRSQSRPVEECGPLNGQVEFVIST